MMMHTVSTLRVEQQCLDERGDVKGTGRWVGQIVVHRGGGNAVPSSVSAVAHGRRIGERIVRRRGGPAWQRRRQGASRVDSPAEACQAVAAGNRRSSGIPEVAFLDLDVDGGECENGRACAREYAVR
jgi:hypothetical protein